MRSGRIIFSLILFFSMLISTIVNAENRYPFAFALETDKQVLVDGLLNEECWKRTLEAGSFVCSYDNKKIAEPQTSFKVVYDEENLYFGIQAKEPDTSKLILKKIARDVWPGGVSSIEIFLDINCDLNTYYQLAANVSGSQYDGYMFNKTWNVDWDVAAKINKNSWTMEIGIKFSDLGISSPKKGSAWGLNVCRNREGGLQNSSSWAEVGSNFHNPAKFNTLIFGTYKDALENKLSEASQKADKISKLLSQFRDKNLTLRTKRINQLRRKFIAKINKIHVTESTFPTLWGEAQFLGQKYKEIETELDILIRIKQN